MCKLGKKYINLWDEPFMQDERLKTKTKLLYLYLLTNALSNIAGVYQITDKRICFDIDIMTSELNPLFLELKALKKVARCGDWVIIKDAPLYIKEMTKTTIKEMDTILYNLPDKIKEKMRRMHYKYAHLYGELLIEEIKNIEKTKTAEHKNNKDLQQNLLFIEGGNYDKKNKNVVFSTKNGNVCKKDNAPPEHNKSPSGQNRTHTNETIENNPIATNENNPNTEDIKEVEKTKNLFDSLNMKKASELTEEKPKEENKKELTLEEKKEIANGMLPFGSCYKNPEEKQKNKQEQEPTERKDIQKTTRRVPLAKFRENFAQDLLKFFQQEGFYQGIAFNYFLKYDFNKGLKTLEHQKITLEDYKDAYVILEAVKNFIKFGKLQKSHETWFKVPFYFYRMCEADNFRLFATEQFDINFFKGELEIDKVVEEVDY